MTIRQQTRALISASVLCALLSIVACEPATTGGNNNNGDNNGNNGNGNGNGNTLNLGTFGDQTLRLNATKRLTLPAATGGTPPYKYTLTPSIPGLTFDESARTLTGTPTQSGSYAMTYTATDAKNVQTSLSFELNVQAPTAPETPYAVYYAIESGILSIDQGTDQEETRWVIQRAITPTGIAIHNKKLYWTKLEHGYQSHTTSYYRADLDGTNIEKLFELEGCTSVGCRLLDATGHEPAAHIAINSNKIYWSTGTLGTISRANLDGTNVETLRKVGLSIGGIAVHNDKLYFTSGCWSNWTTPPACTKPEGLQRIDLDGKNHQTLVVESTMMEVSGNKLRYLDAATTSFLYGGVSVNDEWACWAADQVEDFDNSSYVYCRSSKDGSVQLVHTIDQQLIKERSQGVALRDEWLYWALTAGDYFDQGVYRLNLNAANPVDTSRRVSTAINVHALAIEH